MKVTRRPKRVEVVNSYNTLYVLPTISLNYEIYEGELEYMYIDLSFLKWTIAIAIKHFTYLSNTEE